MLLTEHSKCIPKMNNRVSVVIVCYNRPKQARRTVESLLENGNAPFEVILVDDGSKSPIRIDFPFPNLRLIRFEKEVGLSNARNYGLKEARGDYIAFIDDDTVVSENWLEEVEKGINAGADIIGGPLKPLFNSKPPEWWSEEHFGALAGVGNAQAQEIWGANMVFRREVFEKVGFFNPELGRKNGKLFTYEDRDLIVRAEESSFKPLFVNGAEVFHSVPSSRMTINYVLKWSYYFGKTEKIINGPEVLTSCYALLIAAMQTAYLLFRAKKPDMFKAISRIAVLLGRLS